MTPREASRRARAEHDSIRKHLARLEALASRIPDDDADEAVQAIEGELATLRAELREHLAWEDGESPELRGSPAGGEGSWVRSAHDDLRSVLDFCRHSCGDENHPLLLAERVSDLSELLRQSLDVEEQSEPERTRRAAIASEGAGSVTDLLTVDHGRLDAAFADAKRLLAAGDLDGARERFGVFREGLEIHIDAEERVLFPAFEELAGAAHAGPTAVMRAEHVELRRLMAEVASVLETGAEGGLTTPLAALTARIYAHNGKEERILYPTADRLATEAGTLEDLVDLLRRF